VVLGAVAGASKVAGKSMREHQIVFVGAGSAAIGVADYLRFAMIDDGLSEKEARARFWIIDKDGLLDGNRGDLSDAQKTYARDSNEVKSWPRNSHGQIGLSEAISKLDATILIGLSTVKGIFSESVVREMAKKNRTADHLPVVKPHQPIGGRARRSDRMDGWPGVGGHRFTFCTCQIPREKH
jgi:malate dehydrogenase (oxaloacetate-decarboxylating)